MERIIGVCPICQVPIKKDDDGTEACLHFTGDHTDGLWFCDKENIYRIHTDTEKRWSDFDPYYDPDREECARRMAKG